MGIYNEDDKRKVKVTKPRRVCIQMPAPSPRDGQLQQDNLELIKFLDSIKNKFVWFK